MSAERLLHIGDQLAGRLGQLVPAETTVEGLDGLMRWWEQHPTASLPDAHRQTICQAVFASRPGPITAT